MRGRVLAIFLAIALGGTPLGAPMIGWVADRFGPRWALGVGAAAGFGAAIVGFHYLTKYRHLRVARFAQLDGLRLQRSSMTPTNPLKYHKGMLHEHGLVSLRRPIPSEGSSSRTPSRTGSAGRWEGRFRAHSPNLRREASSSSTVNVALGVHSTSPLPTCPHARSGTSIFATWATGAVAAGIPAVADFPWTARHFGRFHGGDSIPR